MPLSGGLDPIPLSSIFLSSPATLRKPSASSWTGLSSKASSSGGNFWSLVGDIFPDVRSASSERFNWSSWCMSSPRSSLESCLTSILDEGFESGFRSMLIMLTDMLVRCGSKILGRAFGARAATPAQSPLDTFTSVTEFALTDLLLLFRCVVSFSSKLCCASSCFWMADMSPPLSWFAFQGARRFGGRLC